MRQRWALTRSFDSLAADKLLLVTTLCRLVALMDLADGSRVPALCFNLVTPPGPEERNAEYAAKLPHLARRLRLPADYADSIQ